MGFALLDAALLHTLAPADRWLEDHAQRRVAAVQQPSDEIVIVDIDEASLVRMQPVAGKWPWPRAVHGELIDGLVARGARAVVFDVLFSEADAFNPESDRLFDEAVGRHRQVYLPMLQLPAAENQGVPLAEVAPLLGIEKTPQAQANARAALLPPQAVSPAYWRTGLINFLEDEDGVGRRYWVRRDVEGWRIPSLPARVAADLGASLPPDEAIRLNWSGGARAFTHVSYADLFEDFGRRQPQRPADELRGKVVIVGSAAAGLQDLRVTPIASLYPGVQILATALDNLITGQAVVEAPWFWAWGLTLVLVGGLYWRFARGGHVFHQVAALVVGTGLVYVVVVMAAGSRWLLPLASPILIAWAYTLFSGLLAYLHEKRSRAHAVAMFSRFLNPNVVDRIVEQGETIESLSGKSREVTVLFSDIRGFTTLSESRPPEAIVTLLNRYFSRQVEVVFRHHGTLDKFVGDCIMAFWGAPLDDPAHARHAVEAAMEMQAVLADFRRELAEEAAAGGELPDFDVGIGLHTGPAVVGFIGARQKLEYTAIGDTVNLASRIEGLTKGRARVLVSETTRAACPEMAFVSHGGHKVKGRSAEVELFEPVAAAIDDGNRGE